MLITPRGITGANKVPGIYTDFLWGQGSPGIGGIPRPVLLCGYKASSSSLADYTINDVIDPVAAIAECVAGSELAEMIAVASETKGAQLKYFAIPEPSGGTAATLTITIGGSWTTAGSLRLSIDQYDLDVQLTAGTSSIKGTPTTASDGLVADINGTYNIFCSAANVAGVTTLTVKNLGARGNDHFVYVDKRALPAGATVAIAGGTAAANGAVPFSGGAGTDAANLTAILAATLGGFYDYTAWALNEAASIDDIAAQAAQKAMPGDVGPENVVIGFSGTVSAATTRALVMNQQLAQLWHMEGIVAASKIAAALAATRSVQEALPVNFLGNPNANMTDLEIKGLPPHRKAEQNPTTAAQNVALNGGVSTIVSRNGKACIGRSVTSHYKNGSQLDYSTLDTGCVMVPQRFAEHVAVLWAREHRPANPHCGPDPANGNLPPAGLSTPNLWGPIVAGEMAAAEEANCLIKTAENPPVVEFNATLQCLVTNLPNVVTPLNLQLAQVVRQIPIAAA